MRQAPQQNPRYGNDNFSTTEFKAAILNPPWLPQNPLSDSIHYRTISFQKHTISLTTAL